MFGFAPNLMDSGVQKFTPDADSGFPKITQREVFYSVKDGNWNDLNTWQTASGRVGKLPTANDDVYIRNAVSTVNGFSVNNIFISSIFTIPDNSPQSNNIFGNIKCLGKLIIGQFQTLNINGNDNIISSYTFSSSSAIAYNSIYQQNVLPIQYQGLFVNNGKKYINDNIEILQNFAAQNCSFYLNTDNFIVNGTTNIGTNGFSTFYSYVNNTNILFKGSVSIGNSIVGNAIDFSANPNVEFRGGLTFTQQSSAPQFGLSGTGIWSFTTNNQTLTNNGNGTYNCKLLIGSGVTLTIAQTGQNRLNDIINGVDSTSKLLMGLNGILYFDSLASVSSMTTGIWDFTTNVNTIGYTGNYTATIPSYFNTFHNLTITGTGTKSLGVNTTLNGNLNVATQISQNATFELSNYNLIVNGITKVWRDSLLKKSGSGNLTFIGEFQFWNYTSGVLIVDFSIGNPNIEFRGGIDIQNTGNYSLPAILTGTGIWTFTTNNQIIRSSADINQILITDCTILISGAITLTNNVTWFTRGTIDGNNVASKLLNSSTLRIMTITQPMATNGIFDITTTTTNTIGYYQNGAFTIPFGSYRNLEISGQSGTKTLSQNTTINGNLLLNGSLTGTTFIGILECSIYNLIVNGTTTILNPSGATKLLKSGAGSVTFIGQLISFDYGANSLDFSIGNPSVECRGGISSNQGSTAFPVINTGIGLWSFTTNNQTINSNLLLIFNCSILISGTITLSIGSIPFRSNGSINGDNVLSTLRISTNAIITYNSSTQPMAVGILDTSTNLNTWVYGLNNQDIKGGPTTLAKQVYRNLTLNGTGVKTLQGYVSVLNTYTLTAPATLANNGFTLTNP